jgi:hypothetical protein
MSVSSRGNQSPQCLEPHFGRDTEFIFRTKLPAIRRLWQPIRGPVPQSLQ